MSLLPALVIGSAIAGGAAKAAGSIQQGNAQYSQNMYQSQIAQNNAVIADQNAVKALQEGAVKEQAERRQTAQTAGQQRAVLAALGQVIGGGTAQKILGDTAQMGESDAQTIWRNAQNDALGFRSQGADYRASASMDVAAAKSARTAGFIGAAGTVLSTVGSVANFQYNQNKMAVPKGK